MPLPRPIDPPSWSRDALAERRGRFILGPELGRGGMGVVHLAWDPLLMRLVALKQLLHADPLQTLRFLREAQLQAKVEHPRVCKVFEVSADAAQPYIAMQYLEGRPLGEARELDLRELARIFAEVADALHTAHRLGLIHRDLKPSNILLEHHGEEGWVPYLLDFGLARDLASADMTLTWGMVGTPAFMSPEQASGEEVTAAADLYSLGATFFAVFAGRPPHEATTLVGLLAQQAVGSLPALRHLVPGFPRDLETILQKCLEREPSRRYASAFAVGEDLRRWLAGEPIHARPVRWPERAWRQVRHHRALSLSIAGGCLLALSLLAWNVRASRHAQMQIEWTQRFSLQVREVEQLLRIERMLPVHDMRPVEGVVRRRMAEIRDSMNRLGAVAQGPGLAAIGQGHLALGEIAEAGRALEAAWKGGHQTPDVAFALGTLQRERYMAIHATMPQATEAERKAAEAQLAREGLAYFQKARGHLMEDPHYGEAQIAFLKDDFEACIRHCQEAFRARAWFHEAKVLEAEACMSRAMRRVEWGAQRAPAEAQPQALLDQAKGALAMALQLAPSAIRTYHTKLGHIAALSYLQANAGSPDPRIFEETDSIHATLQALRPDDDTALATWLFNRIRHAMTLLKMGKDIRPMMRQTLDQLGPEAAQRPGLNTNLGMVYWQLADGQWRRGEDPRPALRDMERLANADTPPFTQPMCIEAEYRANRGLDPRPVFHRIERILEADRPRGMVDFYHHVLWCHVLMVQAEWETTAGLDARPTLDRALSQADQGLKLNPGVVYLWAFKAQFHARRAQEYLRRTKPCLQDIRTALEAARKARTCGSHYRADLALSEALETDALQRMAQGEDPLPVLEAARAACGEGLKLNPTDHRLHTQAAQLELQVAECANRHGRASDSHLQEAEAILKRGLAIKPDAPRMWLLLARTRRLRADHCAGEGRAAVLRSASLALKRAMELHPALEGAKGESVRLSAMGMGGGPAFSAGTGPVGPETLQQP